MAAAARTVTVLGATGSIGDSTMDLLRGARDRYSVEALTANTNVEALAKLAKEFGARFAAIADPARLGELKDALAGTGIECGAGESAIIEAAARPADWVMAAVSGAAGLKPRIGCGRSRRGGGARQQGMPGLCRRFLHAARGESRRLHPAGGFRTQRTVSGALFRQPRGTGARDHHRLGRAVPHLGRRPTSSRRRWSRP